MTDTGTALLQTTGLAGTFHARLAQTLCRIGAENDPVVLVSAAVASRVLSDGHVCWDTQRPLEEILNVSSALLPSVREWRARLENSALCGGDDTGTPLVLDRSGRLYLRRYYEQEQRLSRLLRDRAPGRLRIISGGPGTGKTTRVAALLARANHDAMRESRPLPSVLVMAPTGKAASRLKESFRQVKAAGAIAGESIPAEAVLKIPDDAQTIHRALGVGVSDPTRIRHHADNPLPVDIAVVDECSMVDLITMTRLLEAVPPHATLVLLGDRHQLVSVEAGAVFADICAAASAGGVLAAGYSELTRSHRFSESSGIGQLARSVQSGDADGAMALLRSGASGDVEWVFTADPEIRRTRMVAQVAAAAGWFELPDDREALRALRSFRIISALREGPAGVEMLNRVIEEHLVNARVIPPGQRNYSGRPVMVTANDYGVGLFNGDTGLIRDFEGAESTAVFEAEGDAVRRISSSRLPAHETAYAMTIHKTQGSEMDHAAVVLPVVSSPILSRELLYTAITRARRHITLYATEAAVRQCVNTTVRRMSGLQDALRDF